MAQVLASPSRVDPREVRPNGNGPRPARSPRGKPQDPGSNRRRTEGGTDPAGKGRPVCVPVSRSSSAQLADLEAFRKGIDPKSYEVGKTVFDSGQ